MDLILQTLGSIFLHLHACQHRLVISIVFHNVSRNPLLTKIQPQALIPHVLNSLSQVGEACTSLSPYYIFPVELTRISMYKLE